MSDPASFQKSKKGVSLKWIAMRNDFLDRRSENLPRLSGYILPTKSLDDKAEWVIPQINTWVTAMADLRMNPPGNGVKLVETTNQTLFVTFVSTLASAQLLYQHFRLMRWCWTHWTPQNWKIVLLNPHVDLLNACFFQAKTDFFDPFGARKPQKAPASTKGRASFVAGQGWKLLKSGWPPKKYET